MIFNVSQRYTTLHTGLLDKMSLYCGPRAQSMSNHQQKPSWLDLNLGLFLGLVFILATATIGIVVFVYFYNFSGPLSISNEAWGQFGDFVGGSLNPILSFFALIALLLTLWVQSRSLDTARKQISQQNEVSSLSAQISAISTLIVSLNEQIAQDNTYTANGGSTHAKGNKQRLDRRDKLLKRLGELYEKLVDTRPVG